MNYRALITAMALLIAGFVFLNRNTISGLALAESNELYPMGDVFPLGVYDAHGDEAFSDLSNSHFNMAHVYSSTMSLEAAERYLKKAAQHNLNVMMNMPSSKLNAGEAFWKEYITACAKYDNLAWWYIPEEPKKDQYEHVENLYNWIKRYDPKKRPAGTYHAGGRTTEALRFWQKVNDFVLSGSYPNYYEQPRIWVKWKMEQEIKGMPEAAPVFCGQFFALDKPPIQPKEAYHDSYLGIVSGAKAIVLYSYSRGISECPKETWEAYKKVADEIGGKGNLGPVILSPDVPQKIKRRISGF